MSYKKTAYQLKVDTDTINKHVSLLTPALIEKIKGLIERNVSETHSQNFPNHSSSLFRPEADQCLLLFRPKENGSFTGPSIYTINMLTLKPTANSSFKEPLTEEILFEFS